MTMNNNMNHTEQLPVVDPRDPRYTDASDAFTTDVPKFQSRESTPVQPQQPQRTAPPAPPQEPKRTPPKTNGTKQKKRKTGVFQNNMTPAYIALTVLTIGVNFLFVYMLFYTTRFSAVSKDIFTKVNLAAMLALLFLDVIVFIAIRSKKVWAFILSCLCLVLAVGGGGYAGYMLTRVDENLEKITSREKTTEVKTSQSLRQKVSRPNMWNTTVSQITSQL